MNQTLWIIGGGVTIIAITVMLYFVSTDSATTTLPNEAAVGLASTTDQYSKDPDPVIPTTKTTPVEETKEINSNSENMNPEPQKTASDIVVLHTSMGDISIKLYVKDAPKASENFIKLAKEGFYDGVRFHRVIKGFMIQSGDPISKDDSKQSAWGTGGPDYRFENESNSHQFVQGSLGMANSGGTNSNGSQFFIVTAPSTPFLNGGYTNFGEVVSGLDVAMAIENVKTDGSANAGTGHDRPIEPVTIKTVEVK